jgi:phosphinothricin acetyltransferase
MTAISVRRVIPDDLSVLLEIYNHYVCKTAITFDIEPRTFAQRQSWLNGFALSGRYQCFVATKNGDVVGWASSYPYNERAAYETTVATSIYLGSGPIKVLAEMAGC